MPSELFDNGKGFSTIVRAQQFPAESYSTTFIEILTTLHRSTSDPHPFLPPLTLCCRCLHYYYSWDWSILNIIVFSACRYAGLGYRNASIDNHIPGIFVFFYFSFSSNTLSTVETVSTSPKHWAPLNCNCIRHILFIESYWSNGAPSDLTFSTAYFPPTGTCCPCRPCLAAPKTLLTSFSSNEYRRALEFFAAWFSNAGVLENRLLLGTKGFSTH